MNLSQLFSSLTSFFSRVFSAKKVSADVAAAQQLVTDVAAAQNVVKTVASDVNAVAGATEGK